MSTEEVTSYTDLSIGGVGVLYYELLSCPDLYLGERRQNWFSGFFLAVIVSLDLRLDQTLRYCLHRQYQIRIIQL